MSKSHIPEDNSYNFSSEERIKLQQIAYKNVGLINRVGEEKISELDLNIPKLIPTNYENYSKYGQKGCLALCGLIGGVLGEIVTLGGEGLNRWESKEWAYSMLAFALIGISSYIPFKFNQNKENYYLEKIKKEQPYYIPNKF